MIFKAILTSVACCFASAVFANPLPNAALSADVVILGEVHDNAEHHQIQAQALLQVGPSAVVFEMLEPAQAAAVADADRSDWAAFDQEIGWTASGWPDFSIYQPIFEALGDTPVFGATAPRADVRAAFKTNAAEIFGPQAGAFGLDLTLPSEQVEIRKELQFDAHCQAMPREMMGAMVEAQRFLDAHFARVVLEALDADGAPVILITGHGHARTDWGVPVALQFARPDLAVYAVGITEGDTGIPFDHVIETAPAEREDPCAVFKS